MGAGGTGQVGAVVASLDGRDLSSARRRMPGLCFRCMLVVLLMHPTDLSWSSSSVVKPKATHGREIE